MDEFKVIEIKKSVFENNDREADRIRERLKKEHTFRCSNSCRKSS